MDPIVSVDEARAQALALCPRPTPVELVALDAAPWGACGRVLRRALHAGLDAPPWPTSMMDGFAVRAGEATAGATLRLVEESAAGRPSTRPLGAGEAAPISTGALLPPGADAVVPGEHTEPAGDGQVRVREAARPGGSVRAPGSELRRGELLLAAGERIDPAGVAILASQGVVEVEVARRPRVAIVPTGAEVRRLGEPLAPGDVHDANTPALAALVEEAGALVETRAPVGDDRQAIAAAIGQLRGADLILLSGGVSVGPHDHVRAAIEAAGGEIVLWRVAMKPGKPLVLARIGETPVVGLPGNPVSAQVGFLLFVRPMLRALLGARPVVDAAQLEVAIDAALTITTDRPTYLRARVRAEGGRLVASLAARQGSAALSSLLGTNALVRVDPGDHRYGAGALLPAWLHDRLR